MISVLVQTYSFLDVGHLVRFLLVSDYVENLMLYSKLVLLASHLQGGMTSKVKSPPGSLRKPYMASA